MAVVSLKIGDGFYKFSCPDGQEGAMREWADELDKRAAALTKSIGHMNEGQLLAIMCMMLVAEKKRASDEHAVGATIEQIAQSIQNLALKVNVMAESLEQ